MEIKKIVLVGNPNIGKSALFSRLTGTKVIASNYPGTTVEFTKGILKLPNGERYEIIDVPGVYSLKANSKSDEVAIQMISEADFIINVVDSTNLERNLNLTVQLLKNFKLPTIVALNMADIAKQRGTTINTDKLSIQLDVPVIPTVAVSGQGIKELIENLAIARPSYLDYEERKRWDVIGNIVESVQVTKHRHPTIKERLSELSVHPIFGILFALIVLFISFWFIRLIGEGLINYLMDPLFETFWVPILEQLSLLLTKGSFWHEMLIGNFISGHIDLEQSFGVLSTGLYIPIAAVLPYVFSFYFILTILEDSGYLPRFGILMDNVMHHIGLHGLTVIPMFLGFGCNVPGALATRMLESRKERFIASTLMAIAVPCMAQLAMISGLIGKYGASAFFVLFGILFLVWLIAGMIMSRFVKGESPEILIDVPPYHFPYLPGVLKKIWMRIKRFIAEAIPFVIIGVFIVNIMYSTGIMKYLGDFFSPVITNVFGLPGDAVSAILVGFLRKDVAVGMLAPLDLGFRQLIVASTVLTVYFPCVATFIVMLRELGSKDMIKSALIMLLTALLVGGAVNWGMVLLGY
jgi:ferrous iron transport protein B